MGFGPFISSDGKHVFCYEGHEKDSQDALLVLDSGKNFYGQVLDFNWHKQSKSPNWDVVDFSESDVLIV